MFLVKNDLAASWEKRLGSDALTKEGQIFLY